MDATQQAKHPVTVLAGRYGHPLHPILVTVPIGAWVASLIFDIASRIIDKPGFLTQGSEWLIGIGILGALAAALFGFLDLLAIPTGTRAFGTGLTHMSLNLAVTVAYSVNFLWRHSSYAGQGRVAIGPLMLSAVSLAALGISGYLGGKLAYRYGVRVADEHTQGEGFITSTTAQTGRSSRHAEQG
jgi:uncharacterized membrane protein